MLLDWHTDFSGGRSSGLVFPSLEEFSTVCCYPHSKRFGIINTAEVDVFLGLSCFFNDPTDVGVTLYKFSCMELWKTHNSSVRHYPLCKLEMENQGDWERFPGYQLVNILVGRVIGGSENQTWEHKFKSPKYIFKSNQTSWFINL